MHEMHSYLSDITHERLNRCVGATSQLIRFIKPAEIVKNFTNFLAKSFPED